MRKPGKIKIAVKLKKKKRKLSKNQGKFSSLYWIQWGP